jgi:dTDP-4-dehydrorhamnose reductase
LLNVTVPINLVTVCNELCIKLIHFSSLLAGRYNLYARSKEYADFYIETFSRDYAIIQIGWMFGLKNDQGFLKTVKEAIDNNKLLNVYDETGVSSYTVDVANYILENIDKLKGKVVVANSGVYTKKELAEAIVKFYKSDIKINYCERKEQYKNNSYKKGNLRSWKEALLDCLLTRESLCVK